MTGPTGLINFFVLEASDYVEQLDSLLRDAGPSGPEAESFTRAARALRGSATMARRGGIAALAAAVERLGRALRERVLPWTPAMNGALRSAVEDLRQLVRAAHAYGPADEQRAQTRTAELLAFAPPSMRAAAPTPIAAGSGTMFVVSGATDVAAALTAAASRPSNHELHAEALRRLRAFRGVAALRDHLALAEALDTVERVARQADRQEPAPGAASTAVLAAGARHLRRLAEDIRSGRPHDRQAPEALAFADAIAHHEAAPGAAVDGVVPVATLFFGDAGPHIVREAASPGTTASDRFRLECAAAAEHLRRTVADARQGAAAAADAARADTEEASGIPYAALHATVRSAATTLVELSRSYGYDQLADALDLAFASIDATDPLALSAADAVGALLVLQRRPVGELARRVGDLAAGRSLGSLVAIGYADVGAPGSTPGSAAVQAATAEVAPAEAAPVAVASVEVASVDAAPDRTAPELSVPVPVPTPMPVPEPLPQPGSPPEPKPETEPEPAPAPAPVPVPLPVASTARTGSAHADTVAADRPPTSAGPTSAGPSPAEPPTVASPGDAERLTERVTGRDLHALLATSIAGFERMQTPAATDVAVGVANGVADGTGAAGAGQTDGPAGAISAGDKTRGDGEAEPISVDLLLYRGRSALGRALELRDEIRRRGGPPPPEQLDELFDLLDLAATA